jgi:dTDP-4-amino-4,6-dideoxygalactose transaminase
VPAAGDLITSQKRKPWSLKVEPMDRIPLLDLNPEIEMLWDELNKAFQQVLRHGRFILGPEVEAFEHKVAQYLGVKHAIGLNSGTDAITIGLKALGVQPDDEVITSPFSFFATAESVSLLGARPVFVDIDPVTFNIDPNQIEMAVTDRTRAIIPVHLFGQAAAMSAVLDIASRHNLTVLEDNAQGLGGKYGDRMLGTIGEVGALSFFPSKNLGAFGDAGMLVTNQDDIAEAAGMLHKHGARQKYFNEMVGFNSRLDSIQAALLTVKLPHLDGFNAARREAATRYDRLLADVPGIVRPREIEPAHHIYHQYTIRIKDADRDKVKTFLDESGISTMIYYPVPLHKLPVYQGSGLELPQSELAAREVLSLPIWPTISEEIQEKITATLLDALEVSK